MENPAAAGIRGNQPVNGFPVAHLLYQSSVAINRDWSRGVANTCRTRKLPLGQAFGPVKGSCDRVQMPPRLAPSPAAVHLPTACSGEREAELDSLFSRLAHAPDSRSGRRPDRLFTQLRLEGPHLRRRALHRVEHPPGNTRHRLPCPPGWPYSGRCLTGPLLVRRHGRTYEFALPDRRVGTL